MNGAGLRMLASAIIYKKAPVGAMFLDGKDKMGNFEPFEYKTRQPEQFRWVVWWSREKKKTDAADPIEFSFVRNATWRQFPPCFEMMYEYEIIICDKWL